MTPAIIPDTVDDTGLFGWWHSGTPAGKRALVAAAMGWGLDAFDVMLFSRQMYTLLKAGVPIMRALAGLEESMINPTFKTVVADLRTSLGKRGLSFRGETESWPS